MTDIGDEATHRQEMKDTVGDLLSCFKSPNPVEQIKDLEDFGSHYLEAINECSKGILNEQESK